jgi:hypothetical protein
MRRSRLKNPIEDICDEIKEWKNLSIEGKISFIGFGSFPRKYLSLVYGSREKSIVADFEDWALDWFQFESYNVKLSTQDESNFNQSLLCKFGGKLYYKNEYAEWSSHFFVWEAVETITSSILWMRYNPHAGNFRVEWEEHVPFKIRDLFDSLVDKNIGKRIRDCIK